MRSQIGSRFLAVSFASAALLGWGQPSGSQYVSWAPDGQHAYVQFYVISPDILDQMVVDGSGNVVWSQAPAKDNVLAWMPDSRHVIATRQVAPRNWDDYAQALGPIHSLYVMAAASQLVELVARNDVEWKAFDSSQQLKDWNKQLYPFVDSSQVLYYLEQAKPQLVAPLVAVAKDIPRSSDAVFNQDNLADPMINELLVREAAPKADASERLLVRSAQKILSAFPSPTGDIVAYESWADKGWGLYLAPAQANTRSVYVGIFGGGGSAVWSPDGVDLAYIQAGDRINWITRVRVRGQSGELNEKPGSGEVLARCADDATLVAWLADGRILFTSATAQLPAIASASTQGWTFYALRTRPTITIERIVTDPLQRRLPLSADFVISPDAAKVAIYGADRGDHSVSAYFIGATKYVSLQNGLYSMKDKATGKVRFLQYQPNTLDNLPSWRTATELSYLIPAGDPAGSPNRAEVVVVSVSDGTERVISKSWPDSSLLARLKK